MWKDIIALIKASEDLITGFVIGVLFVCLVELDLFWFALGVIMLAGIIYVACFMFPKPKKGN